MGLQECIDNVGVCRVMDIRKFMKRKHGQQKSADVQNDDEIPSSSSSSSTVVLDVEKIENTDMNKASSSSVLDVTTLSTEKPIQPRLPSYPKTKFSTQLRGFSASWYSSYDWLEYIEDYDVALCYACRVYAPYESKERPWTHTGWNLWNMAKTPNKGLGGHSSSKTHEIAMKKWKCHEVRQKDGKLVETLLVERVPEHKIWVEAVFIVVKFLATNGLPFRGHEEKTDFSTGDISGGVFLNLFPQILFQIKPELFAIAQRLPLNAKYTSPEIQNEIIDVLHTLLKRKICDYVQAAEIFTVMADGSTDKNGKEIEGFVIRYIDMVELVVKEHCIDVVRADDRSAPGILELMLKSLKKIDLKGGVVSQCYDGANVMSGVNAGLQKLLSEYVRRLVIYVHCFCHRLALVVRDSLKSIPFINDHYDTVSCLYTHFKLNEISKFYEGNALKRLIETRWSGHLNSIKAIDQEVQNVLSCLRRTSAEKSVKVEHRSKSLGLYHQVCNNSFILFNKILKEILEVLNIGTEAFQSKGFNIASSIRLVQECQKQINDISNVYNVKKITDDLEFLSTFYVDEQIRSRRNRNPPSSFDNYIVDASIPSDVEHITPEQLRSIVVELKDVMLAEFKSRFCEENVKLWNSMDALHPNSKRFLDASLLQPLYEYSLTIPNVSKVLLEKNADIEVLNAQCKVHKTVIEEYVKKLDSADVFDVFRELQSNYSATAFVLIMLYRVAITMGYASARVECLFSAMAHIDTPSRRSQSPYRECSLTHLFFERDIVKDITFEDFSKEWNKKPRKLNF